MRLKVLIATVAYGQRYAPLVARLISKFHEVSHGFDVLSWVNTLPPKAPSSVIEGGYDYTGYCAKPFALREAISQGADVAILMDAAFYPIREIHPLVDHIAQVGYYLCNNGFKIGNWASDKTLGQMGLLREDALKMNEASSYCVGINRHNQDAMNLVEQWCESWRSFPGPHTNANRTDQNPGFPKRNPGWCSDDQRVNGHRHDQTALSILAHRLKMTNFIDRPRFTAYENYATEQTVLVNKGGL